MELFRTRDMSVMKNCQEMFHFELPRSRCRDVWAKNEIEHCNLETVFN